MIAGLVVVDEARCGRSAAGVLNVCGCLRDELRTKAGDTVEAADMVFIQGVAQLRTNDSGFNARQTPPSALGFGSLNEWKENGEEYMMVKSEDLQRGMQTRRIGTAIGPPGVVVSSLAALVFERLNRDSSHATLAPR